MLHSSFPPSAYRGRTDEKEENSFASLFVSRLSNHHTWCTGFTNQSKEALSLFCLNETYASLDRHRPDNLSVLFLSPKRRSLVDRRGRKERESVFIPRVRIGNIFLRETASREIGKYQSIFIHLSCVRPSALLTILMT